MCSLWLVEDDCPQAAVVPFLALIEICPILSWHAQEMNSRRQSKVDGRRVNRPYGIGRLQPVIFNDTASALRSIYQRSARIPHANAYPSSMLDADASTPIPYPSDPEDFFDPTLYTRSYGTSFGRHPGNPPENSYSAADPGFPGLFHQSSRQNRNREDFGVDVRSPLNDTLNADSDYESPWISRYGISPPPRTVGMSISSPPGVSLPPIVSAVGGDPIPPTGLLGTAVPAVPQALEADDSTSSLPTTSEDLQVPNVGDHLAPGISIPSEMDPLLRPPSTSAVDDSAVGEFEAHSALRRSSQREREQERERTRTDNNRNRERASLLANYRSERFGGAPMEMRVRGPTIETSAGEASTPTSSTSSGSTRPIRPFPYASVSRIQTSIPSSSTSRSPFDTLQTPFYPSPASPPASFENLRRRLESLPSQGAHMATLSDGTRIGPSSVSLRPPHSALVLGGEGETQTYPRLRVADREAGGGFPLSVYSPSSSFDFTGTRRRSSRQPLEPSSGPRNAADQELSDAIQRERLEIGRSIFGVPPRASGSGCRYLQIR